MNKTVQKNLCTVHSASGIKFELMNRKPASESIQANHSRSIWTDMASGMGLDFANRTQARQCMETIRDCASPAQALKRDNVGEKTIRQLLEFAASRGVHIRESGLGENAWAALRRMTGKDYPTSADFVLWLERLPARGNLARLLKCRSDISATTAAELAEFARKLPRCIHPPRRMPTCTFDVDSVPL
jgi:hypothetical protein